MRIVIPSALPLAVLGVPYFQMATILGPTVIAPFGAGLVLVATTAVRVIWAASA